MQVDWLTTQPFELREIVRDAEVTNAISSVVRGHGT